jgi:hypothetical protein
MCTENSKNPLFFEKVVKIERRVIGKSVEEPAWETSQAKMPLLHVHPVNIGMIEIKVKESYARLFFSLWHILSFFHPFIPFVGLLLLFSLYPPHFMLP